MCGLYLSTARARCGAQGCGALIEVAYEWCPDARGLVDKHLAAEQLRLHAAEAHPEKFGAKRPITPAPRRPL